MEHASLFTSNTFFSYYPKNQVVFPLTFDLLALRRFIHTYKDNLHSRPAAEEFTACKQWIGDRGSILNLYWSGRISTIDSVLVRKRYLVSNPTHMNKKTPEFLLTHAWRKKNSCPVWTAWTELLWIRIGTGSVLLWMRQWTFVFHKMRENSWLAEDRLVSEEKLCSM